MVPAIRVLERNSFKLIGRMRNCHEIDGQRLDRLLFDLLAREYEDNSRHHFTRTLAGHVSRGISQR